MTLPQLVAHVERWGAWWLASIGAASIVIAVALLFAAASVQRSTVQAQQQTREVVATAAQAVEQCAARVEDTERVIGARVYLGLAR